MNAYVFATENSGIHRKTMAVFSSFNKLVEHAIEVGQNRLSLENNKNLAFYSFAAFKFKMNELQEYEDITDDVMEEMDNRGVFDVVKDEDIPFRVFQEGVKRVRSWKWYRLNRNW